MDKKTVSIIIIFITIFLCGLPGLAGLCLGPLALLRSILPYSGVPAEETVQVAGVSIMILGLSLVFISIPIGVGIWTWWSQKTEADSMKKIIIPEEDF